MKKLACLLLVCALAASGCGKADESVSEVTNQGGSVYGEENGEAISIFPKTDLALIGDTMPYFEDGKMNIFYLADLRDGKTGYHPWGLLRTEDFCTYEDAGIVIPYGDSASEQDNALGTGCVMKDKNGLYHAFYTGHNDYYDPKEAIMHATSSDMLNWTKIPGDTFTAGDNYSTSDFRDPYVFWVPEDNCYWMLVVTRTATDGVIAKYTSTDLSKWKDEGIFFADDLGYGTNMECPSVLEYKGKWYLAFSDQWPDRVVHYRISDSLKGEFKKPEKETFDGNGFYAGRLETDGENLYCVGWNGTKFGHDDYNDYDWAGNMVVHQLVQNADGTLQPIVNPNIIEKVAHELPMEPLAMTDTIKKDGGSYQFSGDQYEIVQYDLLDGSTRMEADVSGFKGEDKFGVAFSVDMDNVGCVNFILNIKENRVEFYNTERINDNDPQSFIDYDFTGLDNVHLTVMTNDGVVSMFINNEIALTARVYQCQNARWQLFGINSAVKWDNLALYD